MASGGVYGKAVGIAQLIMIGTGSTTTLFQGSILTSILIGGLTTTITVGTDTIGITSGFLINDFSRTGRVGKGTDLGEDKGPGVFRDIHLEQKDKRM